MDRCFILLEHENGKIKPASYELISAANKLAALKSLKISAILLGANIESLAAEFSVRSGLETIAIEVPRLRTYHSEIIKAALLEFFSEFTFRCLIACHSTQSLDFVPALAVRLSAGCVTAVEDFSEQKGELSYKRSICGGKLVTHMRCDTETTILTIQAGSFGDPKLVPEEDVSVVKRKFDSKPIHITHLDSRESSADDSALKEARVIVAAGRGIEEEENIELIRRFAAMFDRSAVAGSRPLCDIGWLEYNQQVGITGATVSPDLYIACGISGTFQHIIGMRSSGYIIAINKDANSPIFNVSDLCIVEDVNTFIPLIIEEYNKQKNGE